MATATTSDRRGAGGKIVRNRRNPGAMRTPYARPPPKSPPIDDSENPNWLSNLIYPAKVIASGAGKILSFFGTDDSSSSSAGDTSENDDEEEEVENDLSFQGDDRSIKVLSRSSLSDNKRAIEQFVMQETFSREEGDELINLIKSRVVDTNDENATNIRTTAIMEARKWLQQKRSGSKKKMEQDFDVTSLATPSKVTGSGKGSPVDMAKSYMQNRPAWVSPSLRHTEFGSPSPLGILNFKEDTPKSILRSSEMRKSSLSSGSWNILEEIRRVRAKATEELLAATPLTKTALPSFSPEKNQPHDSLANNILPDASASHPSTANQDGDAVRLVEPQESQEAADLKTNEDDLEVLRSTAAENGFPSTASGLSAGHGETPKAAPPEQANGNLDNSSPVVTDIHMEENTNPEQEPAADVTNVNHTDNVVNGSQNSSSMLQEDLSQDLSQPNVEQTSKAQTNDAPKERRSRGYTRRGRARGK